MPVPGGDSDDDDDDNGLLLPVSSATANFSATTTSSSSSSSLTIPSTDLSLLFAALKLKCGGHSSTPLAALMMLNRWSIALGRSSGIPVASMSRKATLLQQQMSPSPSLRAEIGQELLGSHDAANGGKASPFMYDIPLPLFPPSSQPPPTPALAPSAATSSQPPQPHPHAKHFSDSRRYVDSRAFYARQNAEAFEAIVPYGVTTNTFIVDAYARCILAYLADVQHHYDDVRGSAGKSCSNTDNSGRTDRGDTSNLTTSNSKSRSSASTTTTSTSTTIPSSSSRPKTKVYIIELAAGPCLFGYLLAKRLQQAQEEGTLPLSSCWSICVLLTDFNQTLLESRMRTPWMQPLVAAGLVVFAVLDAASSASSSSPSHGTSEEGKEQKEEEETQPLVLLGKEKRVLAPGELRGPVFILGNYALDSIPVDVFMQSKTQLVEVGEDEETGRLTLVPSCAAGAEAGIEAGKREVYPYSGLLQALVGRGEEGVLHVVNVGFLRLLQRIRGLLHPEHKGHLALLLADGTFQYDDPTWRVRDVPGEEEEEEVEGNEEGQEKKEERGEQAPKQMQVQQQDDVEPRAQQYQPLPQHQQQQPCSCDPSTKKRKRKLAIFLPDMSPGPGSGCFALAVDPQALAAAALWALDTEKKESKKGKEEGGEKWLAVRNTVVEGSLTVTLLAKTGERRGDERGREGPSLPHTREVFWKHMCLQNPTDFEHLQGLVLEENDSSSGTKSLLACLGLEGMLALLRWSGYDGDLFLALRWPLRDALMRLHRPAAVGTANEDEEEKEDAIRDVIEVALRCLSNRMVLSLRAWAQTRYSGVQFLYALDCYREAVTFFVHETSGLAGPASLVLSAAAWKEEYNDRFGSAAEAFLVAMSLKHFASKDAAVTVHHILTSVMAGQQLRDGEGRRRIENYLKQQQQQQAAAVAVENE